MARCSVDDAVERSDKNGRPFVEVRNDDASGREVMLVGSSLTPVKKRMCFIRCHSCMQHIFSYLEANKFSLGYIFSCPSTIKLNGDNEMLHIIIT